MAACGRVARGDGVELVAVETADGERRGGVRGTVACRSVWACPVCSASIRRGRQDEAREAGQRWLDGGDARRLVLVTLTLRHSAEDSLASVLGALFEGWRRTAQGEPWARKLRRWGVAGWLRAVEVTWSPAHGWHPHLHLVLFVDGERAREDVRTDSTWLTERWLSRLDSLGRSASPRWGVDVREVAAEGAAYVVEAQDVKADRAAAELVRGDLKRARSGSVVPFDWLDSPGVREAEALWREYERSTRGRKCMAWSSGLLDRLGIVQASEEELIARDRADVAGTMELGVVRLTGAEWGAVCAAGWDYAALGLLLLGGSDAVAALVARAIRRPSGVAPP